MTPVLYSAGETQFNHMGIGTLADSISAHATEERNGAFELEFGYPVNGPLFNELQKDRIIKAKSNDDANMDPQLFRIYYISKPINGQCQYKAEHVSYELGKNPITSVNVTGTAQQFMNAVLANTLFPHRFTAISDDPTTSSSNLIRVSAREAFGGTTGSLIQIWGGELTFDNWLIRHSLNRGTDTGIIVGYGKNLTDLNQEEAIDTAYTSIYPYATIQVPTGEGDDTTTTDQVIELPEKKVESQYVGNYAYGRCLPVDLSGDDVTDEASLRAKAQQYIVSNDIGKPTVNLTVSFINLWQTEEYKSIAPLEHINLCDYVTVRFKKLGVDVKAKVIKTDYDVLAERYLSVELGDPKSNLADDINGMQSSIADVSSTANQAAKTSGYALIQANGKNRNFYSETFPTEGMIKNDILFMKVNGQYLKKYHYDGIQWVLDVSADANDALEAANQAMESANGKTKVFRQAAEPTGELQDNYIWFRDNPDGTITQFTYKNGEWSDPQLAGVKAAQDQANTAVATAQTAAQDAATGITIANAANSAASAAQQTASDAYNQASTAETNAQTAINNASSALSAANAANANANTREKSIIKSSTAPSSPVTDQLWIDTSTTPQLMKRWSGSVWITLSPTQASQIGAVSTTTYTTDITNINNTLSQKASVSTVNTLTGRVDTAETNIAQNANAIALKASQSSVDTLTGRVSTAETNITANATAITSKANQSTVDTITGRVSTAESTITQQVDQIAARITTVNADAKYATQTALMATSSSLTSSIASINNSDLTNICKNPNFDNGSSEGWYGVTTSTGNINVPTVYYGVTAQRDAFSGDLFPVNEGDGISVSVFCWSDHQAHRFSIGLIALDKNKQLISFITGATNADGSGKKIDGVVTIPAGCAYARIWIQIEAFDNFENWYFTQVRVSRAATAVQFSQLQQTVDGISTTVSNKVDTSAYNSYVSQTATTISTLLTKTDAAGTYATQSSLTSTASSLQTSINAKVSTDTYNSKISQLSNDINFRVSKNDVVNQINISTESILITGNKVHITGQTTIDNAVITNAMIASIDIGKATTGTLDANRIGAKTITVDKLDVANLAAITADLGWVTAGTLNAVNINGGHIEGASYRFQTGAQSQYFDGNGADFYNSDTGDQIHLSTVLNVRNNGDLKMVMDSSGLWSSYLYDNTSTNHTVQGGSWFNVTRDGTANIHLRHQEDIINGAPVSFSEVYLDPVNGLYMTGDCVTGHRIAFFDDGGTGIRHTDQYSFDLISNGDVRVGIHTAYVLIGTHLEVDGDASANAWNINSLEALKTDINEYNDSALSVVNNTGIYFYKYKSDVEKGVINDHIGPIIGSGYDLPDSLLSPDKKHVDDHSAVFTAFKAIQELSALHQQDILKIADLESRLSVAESKIASLMEAA